jgi:hypothetical protein
MGTRSHFVFVTGTKVNASRFKQIRHQSTANSTEAGRNLHRTVDHKHLTIHIRAVYCCGNTLGVGLCSKIYQITSSTELCFPQLCSVSFDKCDKILLPIIPLQTHNERSYFPFQTTIPNRSVFQEPKTERKFVRTSLREVGAALLPERENTD